MGTSGIRPGFPGLSRSSGQVTHVLLTRSPLGLLRCCHRMDPVRLACIKHAASVRPEPGSNSPSRSVGPPLRSTTPVDLRESVSGILHPSTNWHQDGRMLSVLVLDKVARSDLERSDHARTSFWLLCSVFKERRAETHVSRETEVSDRMTGGSEGRSDAREG